MHQLSRGVAVLALCVAAPAVAAGDLLVAPTRVILDNSRGTEVILDNIGTQTATYRISLELRRMTKDGRVEEVPSGTATAKEIATLDMIRYAPRRVVLAPHQPQSIRIGVRPPADLPDGEYRAHMLFRAIPDAVPPVAVAGTEGSLSIALTPIYGITIPIIVRKGNLKAQATIAGAEVVKSEGEPAIAISLTRSGDRSTFGGLRVTMDGSSKPVVDVRGIAIYAETADRVVTLNVPAEAVKLMHGPATVEYFEDPDAGGATIARAQVILR